MIIDLLTFIIFNINLIYVFHYKNQNQHVLHTCSILNHPTLYILYQSFSTRNNGLIITLNPEAR